MENGEVFKLRLDINATLVFEVGIYLAIRVHSLDVMCLCALAVRVHIAASVYIEY